MKNNNETKRKLVMGTVISDNMNKTVTVITERTFTHDRVRKVLRINKKYKIHDENEQAKVGDIIMFYQGRPVSKTKCRYLSHIVNKDTLHTK